MMSKYIGAKFQDDFVWFYFWPLAIGVAWMGMLMFSLTVWHYTADLCFDKNPKRLAVSLNFEYNPNVWQEYKMS